ncbi:SdpI family protein [Tindallia californiensis]|uniref:Uncharacterized protein n=1 Tax=Tindallia californiensis TaxID=159292 RepID=A0A1H3Q6D1_9FIRM|nr:SdpI family protein [Tindallia californiensis]SDZ08803.1 hypothetical protein SAMN05192546_108105 [Tindallia californiensis]
MRYVNGKPVPTDPELLKPGKPEKKYRNKKTNRYYRNIAGFVFLILGGLFFVFMMQLEVAIGFIFLGLAILIGLIAILFDVVLKYDIGYEANEKLPEEDPTQAAREALLYDSMKDD